MSINKYMYIPSYALKDEETVKEFTMFFYETNNRLHSIQYGQDEIELQPDEVELKMFKEYKKQNSLVKV